MLQLICKWIHFFQTDILWIVRSSNASGHLSGVHTGSWGIIRASNPRPMLQMLSVLVRVNLAWELKWERLKTRLSSSKSGWDKGSSMYRGYVFINLTFSLSLCVFMSITPCFQCECWRAYSKPLFHQDMSVPWKDTSTLHVCPSGHTRGALERP